MLRQLLLALCFACSAWAAEVRLAWDPNSEPDLAGYRIHYGTASGSYTAHVDVGNVTTCTVPGLADQTRYYFAATAYDILANESGYSNEANWASGEPAPYIGATAIRASKLQQQPEQPIMATFGNIGYGAAGDYEGGTSPRAYLWSYVLSEAGDLTSVVARMQSASGTIDAKILVYQNNGSGGGPGTLLGATQETSVTTTAGNFTFTFASALSLSAGTYWIGSIAESGSVRIFYENETGTLKITENLTYASPDNNPSIAATYTNENGCIVITYTPSGGGTSAVPVFMRSYRARRQ